MREVLAVSTSRSVWWIEAKSEKGVTSWSRLYSSKHLEIQKVKQKGNQRISNKGNG